MHFEYEIGEFLTASKSIFLAKFVKVFCGFPLAYISHLDQFPILIPGFQHKNHCIGRGDAFLPKTNILILEALMVAKFVFHFFPF